MRFLVTNERFLVCFFFFFPRNSSLQRGNTLCATRNSKPLGFSPTFKTALCGAKRLFLDPEGANIGSECPVSPFCAGSTGANSTNAQDSLVPRSSSRFPLGSFPSHAPGAPGICRRAEERNFRGVCCWRLCSRNRWESWSAYARRRGGLRSRDLGPGSSPDAPRAHSGCDLKTIEDKTAKSSSRKKAPTTTRHSLQLGLQTSCSLYCTDRRSTPKLFIGGGGVLMATFCLPPYILFFTTVCAETLCTNCARKRLQITQMYAERLRLAISREWALFWRTQNNLNRSPVRASQDPTTPRRPRLQENGGGALGTTWKPGAASLPRSLGEVGLLSVRCVSRNLCSPAKPIAVVGLPGRLQLLPAAAWRQFWARGEFGSGRRAPGEQVPGSLPQVSAHAGSPG